MTPCLVPIAVALMIVRLAPGPARPRDGHLFRAGPEELPPIWRRLRAVHGKSGLWPLILGTDDDIAVLEDFPRPRPNPRRDGPAGELRAELEEDQVRTRPYPPR